MSGPAELVCDLQPLVFRIQSDVRFSADKSAYNTNPACQFYQGHGQRKCALWFQGCGALACG